MVEEDQSESPGTGGGEATGSSGRAEERRRNNAKKTGELFYIHTRDVEKRGRLGQKEKQPTYSRVRQEDVLVQLMSTQDI